MKNIICNQFSPTNSSLPYFGHFWAIFLKSYLPIHTIISIIVVIFGLILNIFLLIVLTRKKMVSPSNTFLIGISVADTTVLVIYLFTWVTLILGYHPFSFEFNFWSIATLLPYLTFRSISSWITVFLALWRVISIYAPFQTMFKLDNKSALMVVVSCFVVVPLGFIPLLSSIYVERHNCILSIDSSTINRTIYSIGHRKEWLKRIGVSVDGFLMQLLPCLILVILTIMILIKLSESKRRRANLKTDKKEDNDQTANALLAIVILFLICELPIAVILLCAALDVRIIYIVLVKVKYFMIMLRLLNASLNFVLYCFMSALFRTTFMEVFGSCFSRHWTTRWTLKRVSGLDTEKSDSSKKTESIELS